MKNINIILLVLIFGGCSSTLPKQEMTTKEKMNFISNVATNPKVSDSTKYDEKGCIIKPANLSFDDIVIDERNKRFYLPNGQEISKMEAFSLVPGVAICNK